jgi:hypothetical protein
MSQGYFDSDKLVYEFKGYDNNLKRHNLNMKLHEEFEKMEDYISISDFTFLNVTYQDVFSDEHTIYLDAEDGKLLDFNMGTRIFEKHSELLNTIKPGIMEEVNPKDIMEYLKSNDRLLESRLY